MNAPTEPLKTVATQAWRRRYWWLYCPTEPLKTAATQAKPAKPQHIYICGPMTGLPDFNYPAFNDAQRRLNAAGYETKNPARNPQPPCKSWEGYMRAAITQMLTCSAIALLPGWQESRGALIEYQLARELGMDCESLDYFC